MLGLTSSRFECCGASGNWADDLATGYGSQGKVEGIEPTQVGGL